FFVRLRRDRLVADTPAVRIRSAAQGYVKLTGRAMPAGPDATAAPLSSRPCVWWAYEIAQEQRDSKGNAHWHTVERAASVELFALVDEDGARCLVGPVSAEITPTVRNVWYGATARPAGPPPQSAISRESVVSEPANGEPFLIAPLSASQLETRERLFAGLYFLLGLIGVIVCAWALGHAAVS